MFFYIPIVSNTINTFCNCTVLSLRQRCYFGTAGFISEVAEEAVLKLSAAISSMVRI